MLSTSTNYIDSIISREVNVAGITLKIFERGETKKEVTNPGLLLWDSAKRLADHLREIGILTNENLRGKTAIELGCGCGVVGLAFASRGATVVLSDLPEVLPLIEVNISTNSSLYFPSSSSASSSSSGSIFPLELDWNNPSSSLSHLSSSLLPGRELDYILGSELLYVGGFDEGFEPLVKVLKALMTKGRTVAYFADEWDYGNREDFWKLLEKAGLEVKVLVHLPGSCYHCYSITLK